MNLQLASNGHLAVHLTSATDLTGWELRMETVEGMQVGLRQPLISAAATFTFPPSLIGKRYELTAVDLNGEHHTVATGLTSMADNPPAIYDIAFTPTFDTGTGGGGGGGIDFEVFVFDQGTPDDVWLVVHNLGRFPSVTIVDSAGTEVEGQVTHLDDDTVQIEFSAPFGGRAFIGG